MDYKFSHIGIPTTEEKEWDGFYEAGRKEFLYGYMEIRCKAADAEISSAFWATGGQTEFDMFEFFGDHRQPNKEAKGMDKDTYGIEWVKFDADSPMPELMQKLPHVAYYVDDMEEALEGKELLVPTFSPGEGVRVAFIIHNGAPVEFMEIKQ
jgi:hypothetical protein